MDRVKMNRMQKEIKDLNPILRTDSYKVSHYLQYPPGTEGMFSYIEARKASMNQRVMAAVEAMFMGLLRKYKSASSEEDIERIMQAFRKAKIHEFEDTVFFGLQIFLKRYLSKPITQEDIDYAEGFFEKHFGENVFNRSGWEYILENYAGYMPVTIKAVPEGMVIPAGNVMCTIESEDPKCYWAVSYIESSILRAIWYPCTVATTSWEARKIILKYLQKSSDDPYKDLMFKLHDFGDRGVSSLESSGIGDAGHLVNFMGTDTLAGIQTVMDYYDADMAGFSINATEHSTMTGWGREHELDAYRNMLKKFGKPGKVFACVSDSYDIFNACEKIWGEELKEEVIKSGATVVIRPDSGNPTETVVRCLKILDSKFGSKPNSKGYKVLNHVRIIQGDGINIDSIEEISDAVVQSGYSMDNVNYGMGGALLQHMNRDTLRFAMKCSAIKIDGKWIDVYKDPIGDPGKKSKAGKISLYAKRNGHGAAIEYVTMKISDFEHLQVHDVELQMSQKNKSIKEVLVPVYKNGYLMNAWNFEEVRKRASL